MSTKRQRAMQAYGGFQGPATVGHIERNIEAVYPEAFRDLTGNQYGKVMAVANKSYHDGKAAAGAECVDGDLVIVGDVCLPLALLRKLSIRTDDTHTIVKLDGVEIARYPYLL